MSSSSIMLLLAAAQRVRAHPATLSPNPQLQAICKLETSWIFLNTDCVFELDSLTWNFPSYIYPITFWTHLKFSIHNIPWKDIPQPNSFVWSTSLCVLLAANFLLQKKNKPNNNNNTTDKNSTLFYQLYLLFSKPLWFLISITRPPQPIL